MNIEPEPLPGAAVPDRCGQDRVMRLFLEMAGAIAATAFHCSAVSARVDALVAALKAAGVENISVTESASE